MYKVNYENLKKGYAPSIMILGIGIFFAIIFIYASFQGSIKKATMNLDSEVKAYNVQVRYRRTKKGNETTYYYKVNGKEYVYTLSYYPKASETTLKSKNTIYYKSENPNICVSEFETTLKTTDILIMALMLALPVAGAKGILRTTKRIQKVRWLAKNGTLIKGLKYQMVSTGKKDIKKTLMAIQVDYELPSGNVIKLTGDPRYDFKSYDSDGLVDLLIDPNDTNNYYIDFNIM